MSPKYDLRVTCVDLRDFSHKRLTHHSKSKTMDTAHHLHEPVAASADAQGMRCAIRHRAPGRMLVRWWLDTDDEHHSAGHDPWRPRTGSACARPNSVRRCRGLPDRSRAPPRPCRRLAARWCDWCWRWSSGSSHCSAPHRHP